MLLVVASWIIAVSMAEPFHHVAQQNVLGIRVGCSQTFTDQSLFHKCVAGAPRIDWYSGTECEGVVQSSDVSSQYYNCAEDAIGDEYFTITGYSDAECSTPTVPPDAVSRVVNTCVQDGTTGSHRLLYCVEDVWKRRYIVWKSFGSESLCQAFEYYATASQAIANSGRVAYSEDECAESRFDYNHYTFSDGMYCRKDYCQVFTGIGSNKECTVLCKQLKAECLDVGVGDEQYCNDVVKNDCKDDCHAWVKDGILPADC